MNESDKLKSIRVVAKTLIREQRALICLTAVYVTIVWSLRIIAAKPRQLGWMSVVTGAGFAAALITIVVACMLIAFALSSLVGRFAGKSTQRVGSPWSAWGDLLEGKRLAAVFLTLFLYALFMQAFVDMKGRIPSFQPFSWDEQFMLLDRAIHFGHDPWVLLQAFIGPRTTAFLDRVYYLWFPINMMFVLAIAWQRSSTFRSQFFLAFFGLWIVPGTLMAMIFSSAGPCYYHFVVDGANPYAALMDYLRTVSSQYPLTVLDVQLLLWEGHLGRGQLTEGISAMPSLHVAVPVLFAIAGWKLNRALGAAFGIFAVLIFIGSVHLAWHYAVDGYVSVLVAPLIWGAAGWLVKRKSGNEIATEPRDRRPSALPFPPTEVPRPHR